MKKIILILLLIKVTLLGVAQTNSGKVNNKDTIPKYRFEVGTDLLWLIDKNELPDFSLHLKIHNKSKKYHGAYRFMAGINYFYQDSTLFTVSDKSNIKKTSTYVFRSGYQFISHYDKIQLYYGADLHFSYSKYSTDAPYGYVLDSDGIYYARSNLEIINTYESGIIGLMGVSYFINSRISFSLESNFSTYYSHRKHKYGHYNLEFQNRKRIEQQIIKKYSVKFVPISIISINIHF